LLEEFNKRKDGRYGREARCKVCVNEIRKLRYIAHPEAAEKRRLTQCEYSRKWRENNRDQSREITKKWREANPEKAKEHYKQWTGSDPEAAAGALAKYLSKLDIEE
jgi:hypothetical protein